MCGRYASSRSTEELVEQFEITEDDAESAQDPEADGAAEAADRGVKLTGYNIAPTDTVPIVLERLARTKPGDHPANPDPEPPRVVRRLRPLTWGLVPSWSKERTGGARMINARAETLLDKPAYRRAALARRCLVPADGWYEWQVSPTERDAKGKPRKQPFFTRLADGGGLAMAGIYEFWRDRTLPDEDPRSWLVTFAVITTAAEPGLDVVHDRMPLVLPPERWPDWLDPRLDDPDAVRALIERPPPGRFEAWPISTRVNSVRNDGPELLDPAPESELHGALDPVTGELF